MTPTAPAWATLIRDVPDFPSPGVMFRDITPLLADGAAFAAMIEALVRPWRAQDIEVVLGIESRGFILGAAMAQALGAGFVPVRKPGKLPARTLSQAYALEYGSDRLEVHADAVAPGTRVLLVDDVLATGGTLHAALSLAQRLEAEVAGIAVLVELAALQGRARLPATIAFDAPLVF